MALDNLIKICVLAVLLLLIAMFVVPLMAMQSITREATRMTDRVIESANEDTQVYVHKIATGGDLSALREAHEALQDHAAMPGEAGRHNRRLNVALVSFNEFSGSPAAYLPARIDVAGIGDAGLLVIADGPMQWTLDGIHPDHRAKIAFEGNAPVQVTNMPVGYLAGTRIEKLDAYGASGVTSPETDTRGFCASMRAWSKFFEISLDEVRMWRLALPSDAPRISVSSREIRAARGTQDYFGTAREYCSR